MNHFAAFAEVSDGALGVTWNELELVRLKAGQARNKRVTSNKSPHKCEKDVRLPQMSSAVLRIPTFFIHA